MVGVRGSSVLPLLPKKRAEIKGYSTSLAPCLNGGAFFFGGGNRNVSPIILLLAHPSSEPLV